MESLRDGYEAIILMLFAKSDGIRVIDNLYLGSIILRMNSLNGDLEKQIKLGTDGEWIFITCIKNENNKKAVFYVYNKATDLNL